MNATVILRIISIPTQKLENQNSIFSMLYTEAKKIGLVAFDLNIRSLLFEQLDGFVVHFPDHFANNSSFPCSLARSLGLLLSTFVARIRGASIVWVAHNFGHLDIQHPYLTKFVLARFIGMCDAIIFLSKHTMCEFEKTSTLKNCTFHLIYHPSYDHEKNFSPMQEERGFVKIGMIGKQDGYKDPARGLAWYLNSKHPKLRLKLAGRIMVENHDLLEKLLSLDSENNEIANVRLTDEELIKSIHDCDFAILPYMSIANSGMALLVLSCGRPIITSDLPLFRELKGFFGGAWVRIVDDDNIDQHLSNSPTKSDYIHLKNQMDKISLQQIATSHLELLARLQKMR
jgi:beta-1,4-mannosyltransferase